MSDALLHKTCLKRRPCRSIDLTNHVWVVPNPGRLFLRFLHRSLTSKTFSGILEVNRKRFRHRLLPDKRAAIPST